LGYQFIYDGTLKDAGVNGKNMFLEITPNKYKTTEYYFAMCLANDTKVMEDIPKDVVSNGFLIALINENIENVKSLSEEALEQKVPVRGMDSPIIFKRKATQEI